MATGVLMIIAVHNTEAHTHTQKKISVFFSLSIVVASTVLVCGVIGIVVVFASAHHVEVGPAGRGASSRLFGNNMCMPYKDQTCLLPALENSDEGCH